MGFNWLALLMLLRHRKHLFRRGEIFLTYVMWYALDVSLLKVCGLIV